VGKPVGTIHLEHEVDGGIILKWFLKKSDGMLWTEFVSFGLGMILRLLLLPVL
jgi:hypothetical protein